MATKASATVAPTVRRPWLRRMSEELSPRSSTRRGFSASFEGRPLEVVIAEAPQDEHRMLRDGQEPRPLRRHRHAVDV